MDQWIEGVGNEVTVCFLVLSGLLAFSVYKFISSWQPGATFNDVAQQQSAQESEVSDLKVILIIFDVPQLIIMIDINGN